ncbi:hypothetical protein ANACOL_02421 [Anaerotruncus colihominis DSM 17241]|uniref:Uncharacterized protein n=1 Tax=Anaerotruncus colihominis DSM 17241 TaxID=445972 RepID=B0PCB2_9FIRM|nr:hypothetical protein ANACOL_02421 [Anaerotruncus colihominis DSM 17241]
MKLNNVCFGKTHKKLLTKLYKNQLNSLGFSVDIICLPVYNS